MKHDTVDMVGFLVMADPNDRKPPVEAKTPGPKTPRPLESVLLIDDSLTARIFVAAVLGDAGYRVTSAADASAGLAALAGETFDLVLLDVRMPGVDTASLAAAIGEYNVSGRMCILLYSGRSRPDQDALVARCGAQGYVVKTSDPKQLLGVVENAWRRHFYDRAHT